MKKTLFIITGAAGTGKTTVCHYLCQHYPVTRVITHTTRAPRVGEKNGVDYYFETPVSFKKHHYFEAVHYSNAEYGSSKEGLQSAWQKTPLACIVLDTTGACSYLEKTNDRIIVLFLTVGNKNPNILKLRMEKRGDSEQQIQKRLASKTNQRDYDVPESLKGHAIVVQNDNWTHCQKQLDKIIKKVINS